MATPLLQQIKERLGNQACFYVTRDIERALGMVPDESLPYFIITNAADYAKEVASKNPNVMLVKSKAVLDTWKLLEHPETVKKIRPNDFVMVFKNTELIESVCKKNQWRLLNPSAELTNKVEEKISQVDWLGELAKYLPPHEITIAEKIKWINEKFILQFNRAHTGTGTVLIEYENQLNQIKTKFPRRETRVTKFINGPVFTSNNVVAPVSPHTRFAQATAKLAQGGRGVLAGNISYQITGLKPFTDHPFATIGNDWALSEKLLSPEQKKYFSQIVVDVGEKLCQDGWRGLFGVDIIMDEQAGKLYLLEINARQPASTTYETWLQRSVERNVISKEPAFGRLRRPMARQARSNLLTFEAHLASLLDIDLNGYRLQPITNGSQIIYRVPSNGIVPSAEKINSAINQLQKLGLNVIQYNNKKPGSDLLRVQSQHEIIAGHNRLNDLGKEIAETISSN